MARRAQMAEKLLTGLIVMAVLVVIALVANEVTR